MEFKKRRAWTPRVIAQVMFDGCKDLVALPDGDYKERRLFARRHALWKILPQLVDEPVEGDTCDG